MIIHLLATLIAIVYGRLCLLGLSAEEAEKEKMPLYTTWKIINGSTSVFELKTNHAGTGAKGSIDSGHDKVHRHKGSVGHDYG